MQQRQQIRANKCWRRYPDRDTIGGSRAEVFVLVLFVSTFPVETARRGLRIKTEPENGWGRPLWFGRTFHDSPLNKGAWSVPGTIPGLSDPNPDAPLDRVDMSWSGSLTGAVPLPPSENDFLNRHNSRETVMAPDIVPRDLHPPTFPADEDIPVRVANSVTEPITERKVVAKADRLRNGGWAFGPISDFARISDHYPLSPPASKLKNPFPVAYADRVPTAVARYLSEVHNRQIEHQEKSRSGDQFKIVDTDGDGLISAEEFENEIVGFQQKTPNEARILWDQYKFNHPEELTEDEFKRLFRTGFDVGSIARPDLLSVLTASDVAVDMGYWGSGAACPNGTFATGAQLKKQPMSASQDADNTGVNALKLRCGEGGTSTVVSSAEGPGGAWTPEVVCPQGQTIFGIRVRGKTLELSSDNSGVNDLELFCRVPATPGVVPTITRVAADTVTGSIGTAGAADKTKLSFEATPTEGSWSREMDCPGLDSGICGAQVRLQTEDDSDAMGVTDARFYCCGVPLDCTNVCQGQRPGAPSAACADCRRATGRMPIVPIGSESLPSH
eukprot:TRINITY_DN34397_c0_g1_i1.p1 TRINITY_DN34397_c0_g1~~TRINITY_DN34397_c0_g1_i1.p1  ORF type:complete len:557 (+),score=70.09 TRINITY_DN34397_c0_g1_i1:87-1757(+)